MRQSGRSIRDVRAIGAHGQTVRHRPGEFDGTGYTVQLLNGALLAELCDADVVCDLRSRDVAASGQGAPLVPPFHAALFARPGTAQAVLNLGGIANLTLLGAEGSVRGFDCGPGNVLLDLWCQQHLGRTFDDLGSWAASGQVRHSLLSALEADPYFSLAPPKSTGRDRFNAAWLARSLAAVPGVAPADVQATLAELTARRAAADFRTYLPDATRLLVCGGGALNTDLMRRLQALLAGVKVASTADEGLPPTTVEAAAFAWLAQAFVERRPANHPAVTGATGFRVLGALYPAR
jgi:anhydro-N-acetylmuramic acid kinase